jgi:hypothetical protein
MIGNEKKGMIKYIVTMDSIETRGGWSLAQKENAKSCGTCGGHLFYVRQEHGVVDESGDFEWRPKNERSYCLRPTGLALYCGECGEFEDDFFKYFYPEDRVVCSWDDEDLEYEELEVLKHAIFLYNHTGKIDKNSMSYCPVEMLKLQEKLDEYEKKHPKLSINETRKRLKLGKNKVRKNKKVL